MLGTVLVNTYFATEQVPTLVLKISFTVCSCLSFANHADQTNQLKTVYTLYFTLYTMHYVPFRPQLSAAQTSQGRGNMLEMLL